MKLINFKRYKKYKFFLLYVVGFVAITTTTYLSIPIFFDYEKSKDRIEDKIYSDFNLKSSLNIPRLSLKLLDWIIFKPENLVEITFI